MTQEIIEHDKRNPLFIPDLKGGAVLALVLFVGLLAAAGVSRWVQETVHRYHPLVFEDAARAALEAEDFERAVTICTGNLRYTGHRLSTHGIAHLLRAKAHFGLNEIDNASEDVAEAEAYWRTYYHDADTSARHELKEFATELGITFLETDDAEKALQLFSLAGTGSGKPLEYIDELKEKLDGQSLGLIWPDEPFLIVEDFERPECKLFSRWTSPSPRVVDITRVELGNPKSPPADHGVRIAAGQRPEESGSDWYRIPFFMQIPERPCCFRAHVIVKKGSPPKAIVRRFYWAIYKWDTVMGREPTLVSGSKYTVDAVLPGRTSDAPPGWVINIALALPPEECEYLVKRIVLVPGHGKESGNNGKG